MIEPDASGAAWEVWATALAETAVPSSATVTPEMLRSLKDARALPPGRASTTAPIPRSPSKSPGPLRLPTLDVALDAEAGADAPTTDLVVRGVLAEGGMGKIFLAEQRSLARDVAIKTVRDPTDPAQVEALLREGAITGHLDHPGVTPVHLIGTAGGQPALVMKRIAGLVWTELLQADDATWARFPALPKDRLRAHVGLLMEVARTIHFAHTRGVLHLDMKPDNVMIGELGEVYVVDWGVATTFQGTGARMDFVGTPAFVAPEMVHGEEIGPHTDVYLLGATLHLIPTRRPRHDGASFLDAMRSAAESAPVAYGPNVPVDLADLANACTARDPSMRPASALAVRAGLATHLEHATSLDLAKDGEAKLGELTAAMERGELASSGAARLATEARYAFRTALDRWSGNTDARAGLARALEAAARLEIGRENAVGAREALAEMEAPPSALETAVEDLERTTEERAKKARELEAIRADQDLAPGTRERRLLILTIVVLGAIGLVATSSMMVDGMMGVIFPLAPILGGLATLGVVTLVLRRGLMATQVSRRVLATLYLGLAFMGLHRATAVFARLDGAAGEVRSELFLVSAVAAGVAVFVSKRGWWLVGAPLIAVLCVVVWPERATTFYDATAFITLGAMFVALGRGATKRDAPPPPGAG